VVRHGDLLRMIRRGGQVAPEGRDRVLTLPFAPKANPRLFGRNIAVTR
jgi:hypothetical protein